MTKVKSFDPFNGHVTKALKDISIECSLRRTLEERSMSMLQPTRGRSPWPEVDWRRCKGIFPLSLRLFLQLVECVRLSVYLYYFAANQQGAFFRLQVAVNLAARSFKNFSAT